MFTWPAYFNSFDLIIVMILDIQNEELRSLYRSPNVVRVIKSRRLRWAGHVAKKEEGRGAFKTLTGKPTGKRPLKLIEIHEVFTKKKFRCFSKRVVYNYV